eukprot:scaffold41237_cov144-Skeletonema_dohrnii-CCMP3373.AAC.1
MTSILERLYSSRYIYVKPAVLNVIRSYFVAHFLVCEGSHGAAIGAEEVVVTSSSQVSFRWEAAGCEDALAYGALQLSPVKLAIIGETDLAASSSSSSSSLMDRNRRCSPALILVSVGPCMNGPIAMAGAR